MTTSDFNKMLNQLKPRPAKYKKFLKHNSPKKRTCGVSNFKCRMCGSMRAHIKKYGLNMCRRCFRDVATKIGFKKFN